LPSRFTARRREDGVLSCGTVPCTRGPAVAAGDPPVGRPGAAQLPRYDALGRVGSDVHQNPNEPEADMQV